MTRTSTIICFILTLLAFSFTQAENNTTQTVNGVIQTNLTSPYYYIGLTGTNNTLNIINGGNLVVPNAIISIGDGNNANDNQVIVSGTASVFRVNIEGIFVGNRGQGNKLIVTNGGTLLSSNIWIGYDQNGFDHLPLTSSNNLMLVDGVNSKATITNELTVGVFGQSNAMMILDGAKVTAKSTLVSFDPGSSNNFLLISGSGSVLSNQLGAYIGYSDQGNTMTISNGGKLFAGLSAIGALIGSSNNTININGTGSTAYLAGLTIGEAGKRNSLNISNGGHLQTTNVIMGYGINSIENNLRIDGAGSSLVITNSANNGELDVRRGTFTQNAGNAQIDNLIITNSLGSYAFNGGTTVVQQATISNGQTFIVGDGVSQVLFRQSLGSATNTFANGITINTNGYFNFAGTITNTINLNGGSIGGTGNYTGTLNVGNGAIISPGNSPGNMNVGAMNWNSLGIYQWEINDFTGTATNNWDFVTVAGLLNINATSGSKFTIQLGTLDSFNSPGLAQNWNMNVDQAWKILSAGSINGFAANKFNIDLTGFQNPLGTGGFFISQVGNDLYLNFNHLATVPEPSGWILLTLSMLLLIPVRKKILVKFKSRIL